MTSLTKPRSGGCHCGAVRWEADLPDEVVALSCNCSICTKTGFIHVIVEKEDFRITAGEDQLTEYTFNTGAAKHLFCKQCGVKSYYHPRSHPDGISLNLRCFDADQGIAGRIEEFDGANWEANVAAINPDHQDQPA
ncbi:GFA family protein [Hyphobacterium sp.]|uniref:GFA family protein n=1 Tax=Hyphobacterium sp. TaxID=2004662 RepID=UPI003BA90EAE